MVVDTVRGVLYAAQEDVGIWKIPANLKGEPKLIEKVREFGTPAAYDAKTEECAPTGPNPGTGGTHLSADAEGLTIYYKAGRATCSPPARVTAPSLSSTCAATII